MATGSWVSAEGVTLPLAERWNGTHWSLTGVVNPAGSMRAVLYAVSCRSDGSCVAAGFAHGGTGHPVPLVERWNGVRWSVEVVPRPPGAQGSYLFGVTCPAADRCEAVGASDLGPLAERWNGARWRIQATPDTASGGGNLYALSCPTARRCIAAGGSNDGTLVERWRPAGGWRIQSPPNPGGSGYNALYGVSCPTTSACTAVGQSDANTLAERWNGHTWTIQHSRDLPGGQSSVLNAVSCPTRAVCTGFGAANTSTGGVALVERWSGDRWRLQQARNRVGAAQSNLQSVACASPSLCMATGFGGPHTLAERWNGMRWVISPTPNPSSAGGTTSDLDGVACPATTTCLAVGSTLDANGNPRTAIAERWNGAAWAMTPVPLPTGSQFAGLSSVACVSPSSCTAVGGWWTSRGGTLVERWNGTAWRMRHAPSPSHTVQSLNGVSCPTRHDCMAVGGYANADGAFIPYAERWDGTTWTLLHPPNPDPVDGSGLQAVSCVSATACTAVGGAGPTTLAEHWNGTRWHVIPTHDPSAGQGSFFQSVICSAATRCTAVGLDLSQDTGPLSLAEVWDGSGWTRQTTPVIPGAGDLDPPAIACATTDNCVMVGGYTNNYAKLTLAERWPTRTATIHTPGSAVGSSAGHGRSWLTGLPPRSLARRDRTARVITAAK
jgi:hypothetical protein